MYKKVALSTALSFIAISSAAQNYKTEVTGEFADIDEGGSNQRLTAGIRYHFLEVMTARRPYQEAAFLQRSSNVWATHSIYDDDTFDSSELNVGADFFVPESVFFIGGAIARVDSDDGGDTSWRITGGVLPINGMLLTTSHVEDDDYNLNLDMKYVTRMFTGRYLNITANFSDEENDDSYGFGIDYYLHRSTSLGVATQTSDGDSSFTLRGQHFFTPVAFVAVSFSSGERVDTFKVQGGFRF